MAVTIRKLAGPDEFPAMSLNDLRAFSSDRPLSELTDGAARMYAAGGNERVWVGDEGGEIVFNIGVVPFELTMPGGASTSVAGVTWVGVSPTRRRQGLMRRGMDVAIADATARGETLAILYGSEASIYRRVGYGVSTQFRAVSIDARRTALVRPSTSAGQLRYLSPEQAGEELPAIFDRNRIRMPGHISRYPAWWQFHVTAPLPPTDDLSLTYVVAHPDGYVRYRTKERWTDTIADHLIQVDELVAVTDEAHAALWEFLLSLDLVQEIVVPRFPLDDPLPWRLTNPRAVRTTSLVDGLWTRVLDTAAALSARRYSTRSEVVIEVVGGGPGVTGRWRLEGGSDHAACTASRAEVDITLEAADLGSILLGGISPEVLRRAGRLEEHRVGESARLTSMFASDPLPFCTTEF